MHALFCHETYYTRTAEGKVYSYGSFPHVLWEERFLNYFDTLTVIGRKKKMGREEVGNLDLSSGLNVEHILLPNMNEPLRRLLQSNRIYKKIYEQVEKADAIIIRGPVEFGLTAASISRKLKKPYAVEMSGCAFDHTWYYGTLLGKLYAPIKYKRAQYMVRHADAVIYVTEKFLQERYPTLGISEHASNVEIEESGSDVLKARLERLENKSNLLIIGMIGNVVNGLKGLDVALRALGSVKQNLRKTCHESIDFKFRVLGQNNPALWQELIIKNSLEGKIEFCGSVPAGASVINWLDNIDLYLQPSFHEGLPRALIEAMSRGCPVLASDAGGTKELLPEKFIHKRGDSDALCRQLCMMIEEENLEECAKNNFEKAKNYSRQLLVPRRKKFWEDFLEIAKTRKMQTREIKA